jgi:hypothetical protein
MITLLIYSSEEVRKVGGVRDSIACATRLPGPLSFFEANMFNIDESLMLHASYA